MLKEAWTLAVETMSWMEMRKLSEPLALARTVKQLSIGDHDAIRLAHMLVSETVRRRNFIDAFVNNSIEYETIDEYSLGVQAFLRLYVYQTRIAKNCSSVNVVEAANIARLARSILGWKTLVEVEPLLGVLLTQRWAVVFDGATDEECIGLRTFHPTWFVEYCIRLFGRREAMAVLEASVQPPPTYIRLNTLKAEEHEILQELAEDSIRVEKVDPLRRTYRVQATKKPVTETPTFRKGLIYVQDKASCLVAEAADPKPGMTVLDVCAAPGAKTTHFAQLMQNRGNIYSLDYSRRRMTVWKDELVHMGVEIAESIIADARKPIPTSIEADVLVLDPPCTGTGTFGKSPSAKWRLGPRSIDTMAEIQWQMLNSCAEKVKSKGTLIYSTCSITVEENEMLIERFLKWCPEFTLVEITPRLGLQGLRGLDKCQRLFPHIHQCSGSFIARLLKE